MLSAPSIQAVRAAAILKGANHKEEEELVQQLHAPDQKWDTPLWLLNHWHDVQSTMCSKGGTPEILHELLYWLPQFIILATNYLAPSPFHKPNTLIFL